MLKDFSWFSKYKGAVKREVVHLLKGPLKESSAGGKGIADRKTRMGSI